VEGDYFDKDLNPDELLRKWRSQALGNGLRPAALTDTPEGGMPGQSRARRKQHKVGNKGRGAGGKLLVPRTP